jgi:hypothetical protein
LGLAVADLSRKLYGLLSGAMRTLIFDRSECMSL